MTYNYIFKGQTSKHIATNYLTSNEFLDNASKNELFYKFISPLKNKNLALSSKLLNPKESFIYLDLLTFIIFEIETLLIDKNATDNYIKSKIKYLIKDDIILTDIHDFIGFSCMIVLTPVINDLQDIKLNKFEGDKLTYLIKPNIIITIFVLIGDILEKYYPDAEINKSDSNIKKKIDEIVINAYKEIGHSPATNNLHKLLNNTGTNRDLKSNKDTSIVTDIDLYGNGKVSINSQNTALSFYIKDYKKTMARYDKNTSKILQYVMQEANDQHTNEPTIYYKDIVKLGIYKNTDTAKKGFDKSFEKIKKIEVEARIKKHDKKTEIIGKGYFFIWKTSFRGGTTITINPKIKDISYYYSLFPQWAFSLSKKAFSIIRYIMTRARQCTSDLNKKRTFNINLMTINNHLSQPTPEETRNPGRDIIDPIRQAITEIEDTQRAAGLNDIYITDHYDVNGNVNNFLDGYIEIAFNENLVAHYQKLQNKKQKKISKAINKAK